MNRSTPRALPIYWHADSFDPALASIRLRVFQPMEALRKLGHDVQLLTGNLPEPGLVIFSKSDSIEALSIAEQAAARGQPRMAGAQSRVPCKRQLPTGSKDPHSVVGRRVGRREQKGRL